ncbi:MAG: ribokinase [Alphaproteobacteria bacterium]|nr:ribokinase [Alphaproteobacteria bacterium]
MITAILAQIGLPLLVKAIGGALGKIDNPIAKTAVKALEDVNKAVSSNDITPEEIREANRHTEKMKELDGEASMETLRQINETFRAETRSDDAFVRRWRPTFGYAVAIAWVATMGAASYSVIATPDKAPAIISALVNTAPIWGVALGVLGVSVVKRSHDKTIESGQSLERKGLASIVRNIMS